MNTNNKEHSFSHLGEYPYSFDGYEYKSFKAVPEAPTQPGTCCDHCGTGINHVFWFVSADGNRFKVGSSCVEKSGDSGLKNQIKTDLFQHGMRHGFNRAIGPHRHKCRCLNITVAQGEQTSSGSTSRISMLYSKHAMPRVC